MCQIHKQNIPSIPFLIVVCMVTSATGCSVLQRPNWKAPTLAVSDSNLLRRGSTILPGSLAFAKAEIAYAAAMGIYGER